MRCTNTILLLVGIIRVSALDLSFALSFLPYWRASSSSIPAIDGKTVVDAPAPTHGVAIIGAGAGGSSAAFWISKANTRFGHNISIDVYERKSYIGGRSITVYPYNDTTLKPVELGASIFVKDNKNLWRASEEFNFTRIGFDDDESQTGFWDGKDFLLITGGKGAWGWWSNLKVLWRYGYNSPLRVKDIVHSMVDAFLDFYAPDSPRWDNIPALSSTFHWTELTAQTTAEYLDLHGVSKKFTRELVEAATRVNYGQNSDEIHMLEGAASMAANGATSIQGGNFQIFEQFLNRSGANVYLKTVVTDISRSSSSPPTWTVQTSDGRSSTYKAVILAAPFHTSDIALTPALSSLIPKQPYVRLHVTLFTTTAPYPNPAYFGLSSSTRPPRAILTTYEGVRHGGPEPEFNSLTYHGLVGGEEGREEWVVKIFSKKRIEDEWLQNLFDGQVGWVFRKEWDAYPKLPPTTEFPPVRLDEGFYYVNSFEPFISTMETETISSRNIVDLLLHDQYDSGVCGPQSHEHSEVYAEPVSEYPEIVLKPKDKGKERDTFVLGWDCKLKSHP